MVTIQHKVLVPAQAASPTRGTETGSENVPARKSPSRQLLIVGPLIAIAWSLSLAAYLTHTAVLLPLLLLVATASVVRGGSTLLDRLMLAAALLLGATAAGGLVLAVWPWGLHPVAVAGSALTGLIVLAALAGRRPSLPRPGSVDVLSIGATAGAAAFIAWPLLRSSPTHRLSVLAGGEDLGRHIAVFDAIRHTGGYLFQHWQAALGEVYEGMITYPQGSHLLVALLDGFLRSSATEFGTAMNAADHYMGFVVGQYAFMTLTMIWAAQWLAASALTLARRIPLIAFVTAVCLATELMTLVTFGYPSESMGIAEIVLLVAILARPCARRTQQLLIVASLLVAIGFTYYLFLPPAGLAVLGWLLLRRRDHRRHWRRVAAIGLCTTALASFPLVLGMTVGAQGGALWARGAHRPSREQLVVLVCVIAVGLLSARGLRSRIWRVYVWCALASGTLFAGLLAAQKLIGGGNSSGYYTNKSLHLVIAVLTVGVGAIAMALPPARRSAQTATRWMGSLLRLSMVQALVLTLAIAGGFGFIRNDTHYQSAGDMTTARAWWTDKYRNEDTARSVMYMLRNYSTPVLPTVVFTDQPYGTYSKTLFLSLLQRTSGQVAPAQYLRMPLDSPARLERGVLAIGRPMRIIAESQQTYEEAMQLKLRHPELSIEVVLSGV
ncbi:MAG: hypothetical protein HKP61_11910 [Dactylosporangium sp.]|nr:hypothetical protein [Dactylosporangium sp.]NNJ61629.1 hypothetical protein [Dactylosporangium sp.]